MRQQEKIETTLFYIGWSLVFAAAVLVFIYRFLPLPHQQTAVPCTLYSILGIYCPGCGGTRAVSALLHGRPILSFLYHPLVLYTAVVCGWFLISQSIERASAHRYKIGMKYRDVYLWVSLGIVIVNFIVKNLLLIVWHIDLLDHLPDFMR